MPQVEGSFDVDANGILSVKAKDKTSGKEQSIRIEARSSLSKDDIERMKKEAESNATDDAKKKELIEAKNLADQLVYTSEKALKDSKDKIPAEVAKGIEDKVTDLKKAKEGTELEAIKTATEGLSKEIQKIGEILSKAGATPNPSPAGAEKKEGDASTASDGQGNVKDAEFKEGEKK